MVSYNVTLLAMGLTAVLVIALEEVLAPRPWAGGSGDGGGVAATAFVQLFGTGGAGPGAAGYWRRRTGWTGEGVAVTAALVADRVRCGSGEPLGQYPVTVASCLQLVLVQPATGCSHALFHWARDGDHGCGCVSPAARCGPGDLVADAGGNSLYRVTIVTDAADTIALPVEEVFPGATSLPPPPPPGIGVEAIGIETMMQAGKGPDAADATDVVGATDVTCAVLPRSLDPAFGWDHNGHHWEWSPDELLRSRVNIGSVANLRKVLCKLNAGKEAVKGITFGGSIAAGNGLLQQEKSYIRDAGIRGYTYTAWIEHWLRQSFPIRSTNGAQQQHEIKTMSFSASGTCFVCKRMMMLSREIVAADFIILEFAMNDAMQAHRGLQYQGDYWDSVQCMEAIVRYILHMNSDCAIILLPSMLGHRDLGAQELHNIVGSEYSLPTVSLKNAMWPSWVGDKWRSSPVQVCSNYTHRQMQWNEFEPGKFIFFWEIGKHPSVLGQKFMADLVVNLLLTEGEPHRAAQLVDNVTKPDHGRDMGISANGQGLRELVNFVYVASHYVTGGGFEGGGSTDLSKTEFWRVKGRPASQSKGSPPPTSWNYHDHRTGSAWWCHNCTDVLALKVDIRDAYAGAARLIVSTKRSYENFGNFTMTTLFTDPTEHLNQHGAPPVPASPAEGARVAVSGYQERRVTTWEDATLLKFDIPKEADGKGRVVWVVLEPTIPTGKPDAGEIGVVQMAVQVLCERGNKHHLCQSTW